MPLEQAYALALLGELQQSDTTLQQAIALAESLQAWDLVHQWYWTLARLYEGSNFTKASGAYQDAIGIIDRVPLERRSSQVHDDFLAMLFRSDPDLSTILAVNNGRKINQLENYLQCNQLDLVAIYDQEEPDAIVNILYLPDAGVFKVVVSVPLRDGWHHHLVNSIDYAQLVTPLNTLDAFLQYRDLSSLEVEALLRPAQALYQRLLSPVEPYLPDGGTIAFILDGPLQNIPMAMLRADDQYLVERYNIVQTAFPQTYRSNTGNHNILAAGLTDDLPHVGDELEALDQLGSTVLEQFTIEELHKAQGHGIIHLATHGQFSSDPQQTYLLAADGSIDLDRLVQGRSLKLLTLSACQTASRKHFSQFMAGQRSVYSAVDARVLSKVVARGIE